MNQWLLSVGVVLGIVLGVPLTVYSADLDTIQARGYLIVAVKDNRRPLGFIDDQGRLVGFEIDLAMQLAAALFGDPTAIELHPVANRDRIPVVLSGEVDIAIAGVAMTPMRQRVVSFSTPYYLDGTGFVTNQPWIQRLADLNTAAIAVLEASEAVTTVHYHLPGATLVGVPSYEAALAAIAAGQVSAVAADVTVLAGWVQESPDYHLLPEILTVEPLAVVIPKGTQYRTLRRFINSTIEQGHEDGWLEEQATEWGLP